MSDELKRVHDNLKQTIMALEKVMGLPPTEFKRIELYIIESMRSANVDPRKVLAFVKSQSETD